MVAAARAVSEEPSEAASEEGTVPSDWSELECESNTGPAAAGLDLQELRRRNCPAAERDPLTGWTGLTGLQMHPFLNWSKELAGYPLSDSYDSSLLDDISAESRSFPFESVSMPSVCSGDWSESEFD